MRRSPLLLVLLLIGSAAFGQRHGALPPLTAEVEVKVINVDVVATDSQGRPVTNLTADDFEIYEDKLPQRITNFYVIENDAVRGAPNGGNGAGAPFRRKVVLLVDNNYIEKVERDKALNWIDRFVGDSFDSHHEWAIATIGQRLEVLQAFTDDKSKIRAGIARVRTSPAFPFQRELDRAILSDRNRRSEMSPAYDYGESVRFQAREQTYRNLRVVTNTARAIAEMTRAYGAAEGKKVIILLTGGMETNTSFTAYDKAPDREMQETKLLIAKTIDAMVREANEGNFTIHVLNARSRGMIAPQHDVANKSSGIKSPNVFRRGGGTDPIDTTDVDSAPLTVALGTGGVYLPSTAVGESLETVEKLSSNYYSLGYTPRHEDDRRYHSIDVRVKRPGIRLSHRQGYVDLSPEDRLQQFLRARISFDGPTGSLPVTLELGATQSRSEGVTLPLTAALPMTNVTRIPVDGRFVGRVHVYLSVFDGSGKNVAFHHNLREVTLTAAEHDSADASAFRYKMNVRLGKGDFTVVITFRDALSNEIGSAVQAVRI